MGGYRLDPAAMIDVLWQRPMTTTQITKATGRRSGAKTGETLRELAQRGLLSEPRKGGHWSVAGLALAGAAGAVWVNAMVVDAYGVPVAGTQVARRREGSLRDAQEVANDLGTVMSEALGNLPVRRRPQLIGVGAALPYAVDDEGFVASGVARRASTNVEYTLRGKLREGRGLPLWETQWRYTSDVAGEALTEYRHGRADQRSGRWGPVGGTPLMLVKAHREIRLALLLGGQDVAPGGVDLGHVRAALDGLDEAGDSRWTADHEIALRGRFGATADPLCDVCDSNHCLQLVVNPATIYETLNPAGDYGVVFDRARKTASGRPRGDQQVFELIFGAALRESDGPGAAMFRVAGLVLGRALDPIVTVHKPNVLIVTGFLARTEHFRRGVRDALPRHLRQLSIITSSGIRVDGGDVPEDGAHPIQSLEYQFWPTSGAARLALDEAVLPWVKERAAMT